MDHLTAEYLRSVLNYDPATGFFTWKRGRQGTDITLRAGSRPNAQGYIQICIDYKIYLAHRLAFLYMVGRWPLYVDHVNSDRVDNRWCNLREATGSQNNANAKLHRHNTSGYKGVVFSKQAGKFHAKGEWRGKKYHLGTFDTASEAAKAREHWAARTHGPFMRRS